MKKIILFVTFLLLFTFSSFAFEIKGFKGGMTLEEVTIEVHSRNWQISEYAEDHYEIKNLNNERELTFIFCTNKKLKSAAFNYRSESPHTLSELILDYESSGLEIIDTKAYNVRKDIPNIWNIVQIILKSDSSDDNVSISLITSDKNEIFYEIMYSNSKYCETND